MTVIKAESELCKIKDSGRVLKEIFSWIEENIKEGLSTAEIDGIVENMIFEKEAEPAFKGYRGYPATICASINEVVVHGIPSKDAVLKNGDIISIDIGVRKNGYFTDAARTYMIGDVPDEIRRLVEAAEASYNEGVKKAVAGARLSDISNAIENSIRESGFKEVRTFVGHGIGVKLHEAPEIPNFGRKGEGPVLEEGILLAIEPMVNAGTRDIFIKDDGWTAVTKDGKWSSHFENTVIVGKKRSESLT